MISGPLEVISVKVTPEVFVVKVPLEVFLVQVPLEVVLVKVPLELVLVKMPLGLSQGFCHYRGSVIERNRGKNREKDREQKPNYFLHLNCILGLEMSKNN